MLRQQQMEQERRRLETLPDEEMTAAPTQDVPVAEDAVCFDVSSIDITGITAMPQEDVDAVARRYVGTCVGQHAIASLIEAINALYIEHGYITTRTYLPKQNLSQGVLRLSVVEGKIESLQLNQASSADKRKRYFAFPTQEGDILNIRDIEQGLDQLNSVPSGRATVRLWPGDEVGGTQVEVTDVPQDTVRARVDADNYGQKGTGESRIRLGIDADNLLDINDAWSVSYLGSEDTNALVFRLGWAVRRWNLSYVRSYSEYLSVLGEYSELFGQSDTQYFNADYLLFRNTKHVLRVTSGLTTRESKRYINDVKLTPQQLSVASIGLEHIYRTQRWQWLGAVGISQGLDFLGATNDVSGLDHDAPHAQFSKLTVNGSLSWHVSDAYYYRGFLLGQYSPDSLYGSEQLHLGDISTVRGFNYQPAGGDSGLFVRNDLLLLAANRYLSEVTKVVSPELSVFVDAGGTHSVGRDFYGDTSHTLAGAGIALNLRSSRASAQLSMSHPLYADESDMEDGWQIMLSANLKLI